MAVAVAIAVQATQPVIQALFYRYSENGAGRRMRVEDFVRFWKLEQNTTGENAAKEGTEVFTQQVESEL